MSYSSPDFKPFTSGCGMCKPLTDYYSQTQTGGGNYSEDGLIPQSNGKNFYKNIDYEMPLDSKFVKNNLGIDYATANGGVKKRKSKKTKKSMKGGVDMGEIDDIKGLSTQDYALFSSGGAKKRKNKKSMKGGYETHEEEMHNVMDSNSSVMNKMTTHMGSMSSSMNGMSSVMDNNSSPMVNGGSKRKNKKSMKGGYETHEEEMHNVMDSNSSVMNKITTHMGSMSSVMDNNSSPMVNGGSKRKNKKSKKSMKGSSNDYEYTASGGKKSKSPKKTKKSVKSRKLMRGGMESSGATSLPSRFYNSETPLENYPELSGNGITSAYGPIESGDVGTGMLAPYTSSTFSSSNPSSGMKTGGAKKRKTKTTKKSMKGGSDDVSGYSSKEYADYEYTASGGKKSKKSKSTKKPKKSVKSKKSMRGGMESSGTTPLPSRFYNPETPLENYPELSGNGINSAYGPIESGDVGSGMLAPYTSSTCASANPSSMMKTGGSKLQRIPSISDSPVTSVQNGINGAIGSFTSFMSKLDADYLKSVEYVKSIKIGNQRLIQGGSKHKTKKSPKKQKSTKKTSKKLTKKMGMKKGGSNGSDFALTLNSRGPVNAPDNYWGVPGEEWFRQFNKTGDYIPNSKLPYAATPLLAGTNESGVVSGYDESTLAYPSV
jgi:hypothetical protein